MARRHLPLLVLLLALLPAGASAQRVTLEVALTPDTLVNGRTMRLPRVRTQNLLDGRWGQALRNSLPLRLQFEIEIWQSRDGWIDRYERSVEWGVVIRHEALFDQYTVTLPQARGAQEVTLPTWEALQRYFDREILILSRPASRGTYYYHVTLVITTLSEEDLDELERFVRGEETVGAGRERERETSGRGTIRFLLRMTGGLPSETVERRTEKFVVR